MKLVLVMIKKLSAIMGSDHNDLDPIVVVWWQWSVETHGCVSVWASHHKNE